MHAQVFDVPANRRKVTAPKDGVDMQERLAVFQRSIALETYDLQLFGERSLLVLAGFSIPVRQLRPVDRARGADVGKTNARVGKQSGQRIDERFTALEAHNESFADSFM